ncbi:HIT family protein [Microlunatus speluncae]|uniref:HIT family protein n=1 Tax=Microlunatus speluncae TaxID=2594267 RepID=UPI0012661103|nr:HIT family protein [Microlunatus speluncae]
MYNHEPADYDCPFCREDPARATRPLEILRRYQRVTVRLNPKWWPNNPGSALVVPHDHHENVYDLPADLGTPMQQAIRDTALALKTAFDCAGVSTRQHNEPAGNQDVWHYHLHVFPRFRDDGLYGTRGDWVDADRMRTYADRIRAAWPTSDV